MGHFICLPKCLNKWVPFPLKQPVSTSVRIPSALTPQANTSWLMTLDDWRDCLDLAMWTFRHHMARAVTTLPPLWPHHSQAGKLLFIDYLLCQQLLIFKDKSHPETFTAITYTPSLDLILLKLFFKVRSMLGFFVGGEWGGWKGNHK